MSSTARLRRLLRLIELLQSGRPYNSDQLAAECEVSRRTVFRDMQALLEAGFPAVYNHERNAYYLPRPFLIPTQELSPTETMSLLLMCEQVGHLGLGIPFEGSAKAAADKLRLSLPEHLRVLAQKSVEALSIQLDPRNPLHGQRDIFELVMRAIVERKPVRIEYSSPAEREIIKTLLSPYRLLFSRRSWYVIGRSSVHREVRTFNIARFQKAELTSGEYRIPVRFSLEKYLGKAWHLIRDRKNPAKIHVRFSAKVAKNVAEVHWHATQRTTFLPSGELEYHAEVEGINEISWWIMGYGQEAEVLSPASLRQLIASHVAQMQKTYRRKLRTDSPRMAKKKKPAR